MLKCKCFNCSDPAAGLLHIQGNLDLLGYINSAYVFLRVVNQDCKEEPKTTSLCVFEGAELVSL